MDLHVAAEELQCDVMNPLISGPFVLSAATEAAERQAETVPEEDRPAAAEGETSSKAAAAGWKERVSDFQPRPEK